MILESFTKKVALVSHQYQFLDQATGTLVTLVTFKPQHLEILAPLAPLATLALLIPLASISGDLKSLTLKCLRVFSECIVL